MDSVDSTSNIAVEVNNSITDFIAGDEFIYKGFTENDSGVVIELWSRSKSCQCPVCGEMTTKRSGSVRKYPQDLPLMGKHTTLNIKAWRYTCTHPECQITSFTEPLALIGRNAQRTDRLNIMILNEAAGTTGSMASRSLAQMGIKTSRQTILAMQMNLEFPDDSDVTEMAIDDFSTHKGVRYGTSFASTKDHHIMGILNGRNGDTIEQFAEMFPNATVINRDRGSAYGKGLSVYLPDTKQVADRFHLSKNLLDTLHTEIKSSLPPVLYIQTPANVLLPEAPDKINVPKVDPNCQMIAELPYDNTPVVDANGQTIVILPGKSQNISRSSAILANKVKKLNTIQAIQTITSSAGKVNYSALGRQYEISTPTVKTYSQFPADKFLKLQREVESGLESEKERELRDPATYNPVICKALQGGEKGPVVFSLCVHHGYTGPVATMERHISEVAMQMLGKKTCSEGFAMRETYASDIHVVKRFEVMKYISISDRSKMAGTPVAEHFEMLREAYPVVAEADDLFAEWRGIRTPTTFEERKARLDSFIADHDRKDDIGYPFAHGLPTDYDAVLNGMTMESSSGFMEGAQRKIKVIEGTMYGRYETKYLNVKAKMLSALDKNLSTIKEMYRRAPGRPYGSPKRKAA